MKLETLSLKGLLAFTDPCTIDLRAVPPGLVAIVGANGAGKTTIAEAPLAAVYRTLPSREHELVTYCQGKDAYVEATYDTPSGRHRARVQLNADRRASEAVLVRIDADGSQAILSDGKLTTFDAAVARVFPPLETLLASGFGAQNKSGSFGSLDRRGRRALFAQLLGLERYDRMAGIARSRAGDVERERLQLQGARDTVARVLAGMDDEAHLESRAAALADQIAQTQGGQARAARALTDVEARLATLQAAATDRAVQAERCQALGVELQRAQRAVTDTDVDAGETTRRATQATADATARYEAARKDLDARIANNQGVLARTDEIVAAVATREALRLTIARLRSEEDAMRATLTEIEADRSRLDSQVHEADQAWRDVARIREQVATLDTVPCGGADAYGSCRFLQLAVASRADLPEAERRAANREELRAARAECQTSRDAGTAIVTETRQTVQRTERELAAVSPIADLAQPLAVAEARLAELQGQRGQAEASHQQVLHDIHAQHREHMAALQAAREAAERTVADVARQHAEATAALETTLAVVARIDDVTAERARVDADRRSFDADLVRLEAEVSGVKTARATRRTHESDLAEHTSRLEALGRELVEWQWLAKAFGPDGLPTIEIDAAGPTVSAFANQLLEACFGPRFSLELVTQTSKADGKGLKETFDLQVFDNQRGGSARSLSDLSGGEQVIVEEALRNAITLFVAQRSQVPMRTVWRDETTGALDEENAPRYVAMLRRLAELGGFEHVLFVTHNADAAAAADAQIRVADGTAVVVLAPFEEGAAA